MFDTSRCTRVVKWCIVAILLLLHATKLIKHSQS
nr:MAG TPA: hypothetical protein [Caudoviricetes sp.]